MRVEELAPESDFTSVLESTKVVKQDNGKANISQPNENSFELGNVKSRAVNKCKAKLNNNRELRNEETLEVFNELCQTINDEGIYLKTGSDTPQSNEHWDKGRWGN